MKKEVDKPVVSTSSTTDGATVPEPVEGTSTEDDKKNNC